MQISIIGHGRSPESRKWGAQIDAGTVIRMWDWYPWQGKADFGRRYDYGFFEIHPQMMQTFYRNKKIDPSQGWIGSRLFMADRVTDLPPNTHQVDQTPWNDYGRRIGGVGATKKLQFTRGTIAALWAMHRFPGSTLVLVGFDNIEAGVSLEIDKAFCPAYRRNPGTFTFDYYKGGETKHGNHDFTCELPVLNHYAGLNRVRLTTAQKHFA